MEPKMANDHYRRRLKYVVVEPKCEMMSEQFYASDLKPK